MNALLIVGTDVAVGKTVVMSALAAYWHTYRHPETLGLMQPVAVSDRDRTTYTTLFHPYQSPEEITPEVISTTLPLPVELAQQGRSLAFDRIWRQFQILTAQREWVLLEGLGSLGTPLTSDTVMADLAWDWRLPTLLVVPVQAGAIAQAIAQVALARQMRVHLKGIVLNCTQPYTVDEVNALVPDGILRSLAHVPILGCMPYLDDPTNLSRLAQAASDLDLEQIMPLSSRFPFSA